MIVTSPLLRQLIESLRCLPGVGPKSAQRMAFHLLERDREGARHLARTLQQAADNIGRCERCRTFSETPMCGLCANAQRNSELLCIVESPGDVQAIEHAAAFSGLYFVLGGHLSPLDGIGPQDLGLDTLQHRLGEGEVKEVILATNSTVEGEATAHFVAEMARRSGVRSSRLAQGVPLGGELEFLDGNTLAHALSGRRAI